MQDVPQTPPAETIDLASMTVEDSYDGPHLQGQAAHECDIAIPTSTTSSTTMRNLTCLCPRPQEKGHNVIVLAETSKGQQHQQAACSTAAMFCT